MSKYTLALVDMGLDRKKFLVLIIVLRAILSLKQLKTLSNEFNDYYGYDYGEESVATDYVTLAEDPKGDLPEEFTLCSSAFVNNVCPPFYQLLTVKNFKYLKKCCYFYSFIRLMVNHGLI